jgi:hypothetical protein
VGLDLVLPSRTLTHIHNVTKCWSRLDQVFISETSKSILVACNTITQHRGIKTDHLPILTELNLAVSTTEAEPVCNFREVDWDEFGKVLERQVAELEPAGKITMQRQLDQSCVNLTKAIQDTIGEQVPSTRIMPKSKRWWTKELTQL